VKIERNQIPFFLVVVIMREKELPNLYRFINDVENFAPARTKVFVGNSCLHYEQARIVHKVAESSGCENGVTTAHAYAGSRGPYQAGVSYRQRHSRARRIFKVTGGRGERCPCDRWAAGLGDEKKVAGLLWVDFLSLRFSTSGM
jgi:hypothetical protein